MKEIGIEKLIELLNKYDSSNGWKETEEGIDNIWKIYEFHSELQIISKKYGFIGWLVENDKIDKKKIRNPIMHYKVEEDREGGIHYYDLDFANKTNSLLMALSISDTPIEDLISYLK